MTRCAHDLACAAAGADFPPAAELERKRSERSRQPFVLMLIERSEPVLAATAWARARALRAAAVIRETDVAGWYKDGALGVIFAGARGR